uniref:mannose-specific lectin-like n=1 Tax=Scatophagus argus TaxID=75038 RepID=UPI001ED7F63A|nr:mannose-specific lectin-like [Scatophagus argus]
MSRNFLSKNDELRRGDSLRSNNGEWEAIFQDDCNFVIYTNGTPVWASDTYGFDGFRLCMQGDCNLVMYNQNDEPRWNTSTYRLESNMCRLQLTNDGKLELYREAEKIWSSDDSKGNKL